MGYHYILGTASVLLHFSCLAPYIFFILKGIIKPHGFTWLLWGLLAGITFSVQLYEHAGAGAWLSCTSMMLNVFITALAFRYGTFKITRSDWIVLAIALMTIPLWLLTKNPLWSVIIICIINALATVPTFQKAWSLPREESILTFFIGGAATFLSIAALDNFDVTTWLYPLTAGTGDLALVGLLFARRLMVNI